MEDVTFGGFPNETAYGLCADFWATGARLRKSDAEAREKSQSLHQNTMEEPQ